jgi:ribosomal protein S27E
VNRDEVEAAFRKLVLECQCPNCGARFTEYAYQWGQAWSEGRHDLLQEQRSTERDSPYKVKCESCGQRAYVDYFKRHAVSSGEES